MEKEGAACDALRPRLMISAHFILTSVSLTFPYFFPAGAAGCIINVFLFLFFFLFFVCSGWKRVSPISKRASTGARTWSATWPTTMSTTGFGHRSSSEARPTASTSRSSFRCAIARSSPALPFRARRPSRCSTTSLTLPPANRLHGSLRATSSLTASPPTKDDSPPPMRYVCLDGSFTHSCTHSFARSFTIPHDFYYLFT